MWIAFCLGLAAGILVSHWVHRVGLRALVKKGTIKVLDND